MKQARRQILWLAALALGVLAAPERAGALTVMPSPPLLEELACSGKLPTTVREWNPAWGVGTVHRCRSLTSEERAQLRALVRAHAQDEIEPFRAALKSGSTFILLVALDGLPFGRLSTGWHDGPMPTTLVRDQDARIVAALLPDVAKHAKAPAPKRHFETPSNVPVRAMRVLSLLAGLSPDAEVASRALDELIEAVSVHGDAPYHAWFTEDLLGQALQLRPEMPLEEGQRRALVSIVRDRLGRPRMPPKTGYLVAALGEPDLTKAFASRVTAKTEAGLETLARLDFPGTRERIRAVLEHGDHPVFSAQRAAAILPDASYVPYLERMLGRDTWPNQAKPRLAALVAIGGPEATAVLRRLVERESRAERPELLEAAADSWLEVDPGAASWIRARMRELPATHRVRLLRVLIRHGAPDLLPVARSYLERGATPMIRKQALLAVGEELRRDEQEDGPFDLLHARLRAEHPRRRLQDFGDPYAPNTWTGALEAIQIAERAPAETETLLLEWLRELPRAEHRAHIPVVRTLGAVGGGRALEALAPWCRHFAAGPSAADLREAARMASARIERRRAD